MYELTIPSTGVKVKYRSYTIREEKLLLLAEQSGELQVMLSTLKELISACTNEKVDVESLAIFDLEYFMATLRSKSVGEAVRLSFPCDADPKHDRITVDVDLSKIKVATNPDHKKVIPLYDDVGVIMRYPNIDMIETLQKIETDPDVIFGVIYDCIESIYDGQEVHMAAEQKPEDIAEFIDQLDRTEFMKLSNFFETMPKFEHTIEYTCPACGHKHSKFIKGFENFF